MYYGEIKKCDIANGIGTRVSLFVSGCRNRCKNCFNEATWDFCYGQEFTADTEESILKMLEPEYIHGLTVLGGEPFEPENQKELLPFLEKVRNAYPDKTIWMFSGFTLEELQGASRAKTEYTEKILKLIDVLVDGRYDEAKRNISLKFRGSENQRLINMPETLKSAKIVLWGE